MFIGPGPILKQIDDLIAEGSRIREMVEKRSSLGTYDVYGKFVMAAIAAIVRITGENSVFYKQMQTEFADSNHDVGRKFYRLLPILDALRDNIASGHLQSIEELIHASVFADFLEMANYLLGEGYKDAAAVLIGGVLEGHIRKLCAKNTISVEFVDNQGNLRAKKADAMNSELGSASVYSKLDQKNLTAWLDLRNKAAHGQYGEYTKQQVELFLQSVTDFMSRNPA